MPLSPGTRLGTYEIVGPLGAGGMGEVYRARDLRLRRHVAVKVLPPDVASSPDRRARFEREAHAVAALNHPNIVTLLTAEDNDGVPFLTMELVEGQTLSTLVTPGGLPLSRLLDIAIPLTDALVAAHERGVIHRDLKPGNVMVTREGRVKVLDFGLAMMTASDVSPQEETIAATTESRDALAGTVPYMAPEQIREERVDARSDLFALGLVLYELATGQRPFPGDSRADVSSSILRDAPEPLTRFRADLPSDLDRIVRRCLEKNPRERVQSALDVNNELRGLRKSLDRGESEKPPSKKVPSIAVLPFANRSSSADDEYFSDGLADEVLNVLSTIKGLRVTARTSSFHFKGKDTTIAEIGRALDVAMVLEGSVRKAGNRIRVSVQLVDVSNSSHLWSETYDRTLNDIFEVQDDIAQSVVKELRMALLGEGEDSVAGGQVKEAVAKAAKGRTTNAEAHRLYLQGRHFRDRMTREDTTKAIEYLKQALELDREFALAWLELGRAYGMEADWGWVSLAEGYGRARNAVERGLSLEPDLAEAHAGMGRIQVNYAWDWRAADDSYRRALELNPRSFLALSGAGTLASILGNLEQAIEFYRRALELDPLSAGSHIGLGISLVKAGRMDEATKVLRMAVELSPQRAVTRSILAVILSEQGLGEEALAEANREPYEKARLWALAITYWKLGRIAESDEVLRQKIEKYAEEGPTGIAEIYAARGEVGPAFEWLERAYSQRDGDILQAKTSPVFQSLHGDARWGMLMKKLRFEE